MNKVIQSAETFLKSKGVKKPQMVIYGSIAVVSAIAIFIVIRKIRQAQNAKWTSATTQARLEDQLTNLNTSDTTISKGDAITISQNLLGAMDRWGTDEDAIIDNLNRCKTKGDLNLVIQTFGIKPYDGTGLADTFLSRQIAGVMKNLTGWLRSELSGSTLREVKSIFEKLNVPF